VAFSESRLVAVLAAVLEAPASGRERLIEQLCGGDAAFELTIRELAAASDRAGRTSDLQEAVARPPGTAQALTPLAPGTRVGAYEIEAVVAIGGMGIVYRARDTVLETTVALKAMKPEIARDERARRKLRDEARIAARLSHHPNIATVFAFLDHGDEAYIVSRFIEGENLRARLRRGPIAPREAISIVLDVLDALGAAHAAGIVHRDLKPENVMCSREGRTVVLDFGIALRQMPAPDLTTATIGSPGTVGYMSPEQLRDLPVDGRSDLFALGIVFYELLTGRHPFGDRASLSAFGAVLVDAPHALSDAERAGLPAGTESIIDTALAKRPEDRFSSAAAMATALRAVRDGHATGGPLPVVPPPSRRAHDAVFWWGVHELVAGVIYWLLLVPLWLVRNEIPYVDWRLLFFPLLGTLCVVPTLRLHLAFVLRVHPARAAAYHARYWPWIRVGDAVFALALVTIGALLVGRHPGWAVLFVAFGLGSAVVAAVVEAQTATDALDALEPAAPDA
jgi:serine/threonine protein kinase